MQQTLLDDIINTVNELVFRAINAIESGFAHASPESIGFRSPPAADPLSEDDTRDALLEQKQTEIDSGIVKLESLLNAIVDKDFDKFEIYTLRNILAVGHEEDGDLAKWVRLEHYHDLKLDVVGESGETGSGVTPEELQMQRRKVQETAKLNAMLKAEEARNATVLEQLHSLLGQETRQEGAPPQQVSPFGFLATSEYTSTASHPLTQNLQHAASQLPVLRELLGRLKSSLATLPSARQARQDGGSVEAKRSEYIDAQSRRALQRRGLEAGSSELNIASAGRRIGTDELRGLESVVQALGGADRRAGKGDEMGE